MIVITGAGGFIGSNILADLYEADKGAIVACDYWGEDERWRNIAKHHVEHFISPQELLEWLRGRSSRIEAVIHMGAISATTERDVGLLIERNIHATVDLWDACTELAIPFIYASSAATYGGLEEGFSDDESLEALSTLRPLNAYGWSKHATDRILMKRVAEGAKTPPQWAGLKFFNVYGPNEYHKGDMRSVVCKFFPDVQAGKPIRLFKSDRAGIADGAQSRDFVYVKDCSKAIMRMLKQPEISGLFNIGSGKARSFSDLIRAIGAALGQSVEFDFVGMPEHLKGKYQYFTEADMTKLLRHDPDMFFRSIEEGVADYVQNYLAIDDPYR